MNDCGNLIMDIKVGAQWVCKSGLEFVKLEYILISNA